MPSVRQIVINGETLISVKGGLHMSGRSIAELSELGLAVNGVTIEPELKYKGVHVDDFGPDVPADVQWMLASVRVTARLVHFNPEILEVCLDESMANGGWRYAAGPLNSDVGRAGTLAPYGKLLGKRKRMYESGNNFFSVNLESEVLGDPWRFRMCHLYERPLVLPLGAKASVAEVQFRALPYLDPLVSGAYSGVVGGTITIDGVVYSRRRELISSGSILWDRTADV